MRSSIVEPTAWDVDVPEVGATFHVTKKQMARVRDTEAEVLYEVMHSNTPVDLGQARFATFQDVLDAISAVTPHLVQVQEATEAMYLLRKAAETAYRVKAVHP